MHACIRASVKRRIHTDMLMHVLHFLYTEICSRDCLHFFKNVVLVTGLARASRENDVLNLSGNYSG